MKKIISALMLLGIITLNACIDDNENTPVISDSIKEFILLNYPDATIRDADYDRGYTEVEIYHDARLKDIYFSTSDAWVATKWDVSIADLPTAITATLAEHYPDYRIDDADKVTTPERTLYYIELERGNYEKSIYITPEGELVTQ